MKNKINCILLIDDDDASNFISQHVIKKANITDNIVTVLNGKEAIDYLTNGGKFKENGPAFPCPALIFLDINMPVMDGWQFLKEYEKLEKEQKGQIIIMMLTTSFNPDDKKKADNIPEVSGYQNKPLTVEMLKNIMNDYFVD
jgi:CheY-like chemotaxis protein